MAPRKLPDPKVLLPLACLALAGCSSTGALTSATPVAQTAAPKAADNGKMDEVTRSILMAAGLDPSDPTKAREIRRQVAAVVQVRVRGRTYGTALANPSPGRLAFVDPAAVANLLAGQAPKAELARALKGPLVDVASESCRDNSRAARKARKAFRLPKAVCPSPSGEIWADMSRREMAVELHLAPQLAALVRQAPSADPGLAPPTLFAARNDAETIPEAPIAPEPHVIMAEVPDEPAPARARTAVNLLSPDAVVAVAQPEPPPAAAPVSLLAPVVLPPAPATAQASAPQPDSSTWNALLGPTPVAATPAQRQPVVLAMPTAPQPEAVQPATATFASAPSSAIVAGGASLLPTVYGRTAVAETNDSYAPRGEVRVTDDSYRPVPATATTKLFQTKY